MSEDISKKTTDMKFKELEHRLSKHYGKRGTHQYRHILTMLGELRMLFLDTKDVGNCGDVNDKR